MKHIYDLLDSIRQRPGMYILDKSLAELETYLHGYESCLKINDIEENHPYKPFCNRDFMAWLYARTSWATNCGWAHAITQHSSNNDEALECFFQLIDEYKSL